MGYYDTCAFPKPKEKKKKLLCNGYKKKAERFCRYCKTPFAERHEIFSGSANRQISIREGFQIDVCNSHHRELQENITDWAQKENRKLKKACQLKWEKKLIDAGTDPKSVREAWMLLIGRNYL